MPLANELAGDCQGRVDALAVEIAAATRLDWIEGFDRFTHYTRRRVVAYDLAREYRELARGR